MNSLHCAIASHAYYLNMWVTLIITLHCKRCIVPCPISQLADWSPFMGIPDKRLAPVLMRSCSNCGLIMYLVKQHLLPHPASQHRILVKTSNRRFGKLRGSTSTANQRRLQRQLLRVHSSVQTSYVVAAVEVVVVIARGPAARIYRRQCLRKRQQKI